MRRKSLLNENDVIILSLNQSECHKLLWFVPYRIGVSQDIGTVGVLVSNLINVAYLKLIE